MAIARRLREKHARGTALAIDFDVIRQALYDNADYAETSSVIKARDFIAACRRLLMSPSRAKHGGSGGGVEFEFDMKNIAGLMASAESWLGSLTAVDAGGAGPVGTDLRDYRT